MTPFLAQVMIFAGNFAPRGWAFCNGQLLDIKTNDALYSLIGTTYGGDGLTTFALPDLRSRAPIHMGTGPGLPNHKLGQKGGTDTVTLQTSEMPSHRHTLVGSNASGNVSTVANHTLATSGTTAPPTGPYTADAPNSTMNPNAIGTTGSGAPHNNMQPYLTLNYVIALVGVYPSRS